MPALPLMSPPTCASPATRSSSSSVGWLERWSLIASSPTPRTRSISDDVAADAAGDRRRRHVVAAGVAPGADALPRLARAPRSPARPGVRTASSVPSTPIAVVTPPRGEPAERERRDAGVRARLAAAAGEVHVAVDEAGNDAAAGEIDSRAPRFRESAGARCRSRRSARRPPAGACGRRGGGVELGVEEEVEHMAEKLPRGRMGGYVAAYLRRL